METEIIKSRANKHLIFKVYKIEGGKREWVEVFCKKEEAEEFVARLTKSKSGDKSKSKKIAIFSNGFTREYKGDRNVKAAISSTAYQEEQCRQISEQVLHFWCRNWGSSRWPYSELELFDVQYARRPHCKPRKLHWPWRCWARRQRGHSFAKQTWTQNNSQQ